MTLCDHGSHKDKWVAATIRVRIQKKGARQSSIETAKQIDTCIEHLTVFVEDAWRLNHRDTDFIRITLEEVPGSTTKEAADASGSE
jgi:hypothetical protein